MKEFIKKHKFILILFSISFILRLIYISIVKTPIVSDFKMMYDASNELLSGTNNYTKNAYFIMWGYQTGHVFYQYILLKLFNSVLFLKLINCLITSFTTMFIYLISLKSTSNKTAKIISVLYALFPFPLLLNSVLTNQHLPLLLILISVYVLLNINYKKKYIFKSILIGILLGLSNILRSEGIVLIISIFIFYVFLSKKESFKKLLLSFLIIVLSYLCITKGASYLFIRTNISKNGLSNQNTYWKFVCGLNYESSGVYTEKDASIYSLDKDKAKEETFNRIKKVNKLPILFIKKTKILWFNSDLSWSIGHINNRTIYKVLNTINQLFIIAILILFIIGLKKILLFDKTYILCFVILLIYTGIYMFIEVMPRYAYSLQPYIFILASYGLDVVFSFRKKK